MHSHHCFDDALVFSCRQSASGSSHTSNSGRFVLELNDESTWILYSSNMDIELFYAAGEDGAPNT